MRVIVQNDVTMDYDVSRPQHRLDSWDPATFCNKKKCFFLNETKSLVQIDCVRSKTATQEPGQHRFF